MKFNDYANMQRRLLPLEINLIMQLDYSIFKQGHILALILIAKEVREQKNAEAHLLAGALLDAEAKRKKP